MHRVGVLDIVRFRTLRGGYQLLWARHQANFEEAKNGEVRVAEWMQS